MNLGQKPESSGVDLGLGEDDDDLEAELARILGKSKKVKQLPPPPVNDRRTQVQAMGSIDIGSDIDDEDVDENDPELLGELQMLSVDDDAESEGEVEEEEVKEVSQLDLVRSRLAMYRAAEAKAKGEKEASRARRFNRGVKTLEKLLKRVEGGEIVPYNEIPPEVATNLKPAEPEQPNLPEENPSPLPEMKPERSPPEELMTWDPDPPKIEPKPIPEDPVPDNSNSTPIESYEDPETEEKSEQPIVLLLRTRRDEYRKQALVAKKSGDMATALASVRMVKACDQLIDSSLAGKIVNESDIPPPPVPTDKKPHKKNEVQKTVPGVPYVAGAIFSTPKTVQEALDQRLDYFEKALRKAETTGARNDVRKLGDIVKIYKNAIRLHQRGSQIPYERLPTPPGCPPIPIAFKI